MNTDPQQIREQVDAVLADLPGYGYAAVAKDDKARWQRVMANYLVTRENLKGIVLLCDPRHGLTELDEVLLEVIRPRVEEGLKFLVVLTKADKLGHGEAQATLRLICQRCLEPMDQALAVDRPFRFVSSEQVALDEDDQSEEDLLVASQAFDAMALIEDELILALPLVPRHPECLPPA